MGRYGRWFVGAECNTAWNCLDRHVQAGHGARAALIYDSPITGQKKTYTYAALTDEVATLAAVIRDMGVETGDRVVVYMPMIPEGPSPRLPVPESAPSTPSSSEALPD